MAKNYVITYPKYKQEAYSKFNMALVNFLVHNGVCHLLSLVV